MSIEAKSAGPALYEPIDLYEEEADPSELVKDFVAHITAVYFSEYPDDVRDLLNAGKVLDEILSILVRYDYSRIKDFYDWPLVDLFELIDCVGLDGLEEILDWSVSVLAAGTLAPVPTDGLIRVYADCTGWTLIPEDPVELAGTVFLSLVAVYNKTLSILSG